jgi:hypothetical protein
VRDDQACKKGDPVTRIQARNETAILAVHRQDASIQNPAANRSAPLTRAPWRPSGAIFSNATKPVSARIFLGFVFTDDERNDLAAFLSAL